MTATLSGFGDREKLETIRKELLEDHEFSDSFIKDGINIAIDRLIEEEKNNSGFNIGFYIDAVSED